MEDLKAFLALLEATVRAPRLSGSKVAQLSEKSLTFLPKASDLVTSFLRLNNSLQLASQARISSLYVFDAIARGAKTAVSKGNKDAISLAMKLEAVVESLVAGMMIDGKGGVWTEGKDKTRKIIDIWVKSATFTPQAIDRLKAKLSAAVVTAPSTTPIHSPPRPVMSPALPPLDMAKSASGISGIGEGTPAALSGLPGSLPPEILKLLGIAQQAATPPPSHGAASKDPRLNGDTSLPTAPSQSPPAGALDFASLLANIRSAAAAVQPSRAPPPVQKQPSVASIALDPAQLAVLANLANIAKAPPTVGQAYRSLAPAHPPTSTTSQYEVRSPPSQEYNPLPDRQGFPSSSRDQYPPGRGQGLSPPPQRDYHARTESREYDRPSSREYAYDRPAVQRDYPPARDSDHRPRERGWDDRSPSRPRQSNFDSGPAGVHPRPRSRSPERFRSQRRDDDRAGPRDNDYDRGRGRGTGRGRGRGRGGWQEERHSERKQVDQGHEPPIQQQVTSGRAPLPGFGMQGKDEFGRDLPAAAQGDSEEDMALDDGSDDGQPTPLTEVEVSAGLPSKPLTTTLEPPPRPVDPPFPGSGLPLPPQPPQSSITALSPAALATAPKQPALLTLDTFDRSSFNPGDPGSWLGLAQAWKASMGREPNQMELMGFLMGGDGIPSGGMSGSQGGGLTGGASEVMGAESVGYMGEGLGHPDQGMGYAGEMGSGPVADEYGGGGRGGYRGRGRGRGRGGY